MWRLINFSTNWNWQGFINPSTASTVGNSGAAFKRLDGYLGKKKSNSIFFAITLCHLQGNLMWQALKKSEDTINMNISFQKSYRCCGAIPKKELCNQILPFGCNLFLFIQRIQHMNRSTRNNIACNAVCM